MGGAWCLRLSAVIVVADAFVRHAPLASVPRFASVAEDSLALVEEGVRLESLGEAMEALDRFEAALELDSRNWQALFQMGSLNVAHGLLEEGAEFFERALEINPSHEPSSQCLALLEDADVSALEEEIEVSLRAEQAELDALASDEPSLVPLAVAQASRVARVPKFLDDGEIDSLVAVAREVQAEKGAVERSTRGAGGWSTIYLNSRLKEKLPWLHDRLFEAARAVDAESWNHVLRDRSLQLRCAEFHTVTPPGNLAYEEHYDQGSLVTVDIMLSDESDFGGGTFSTLEIDDVLVEHTFQKGDLMLFLSHKYHCVSPVTSGRRNVFVAEIWEGAPGTCNCRREARVGDCRACAPLAPALRTP